MAPYDEKIDDMATALQREVSAEIEALSGADRPDCLYPNHAAFYRPAGWTSARWRSAPRRTT